MTQKEKVLNWLQTHGEITTYEATYELGITRLAPRISELQEDGHNIDRENWKTITDKDGKKKQVKLYEYTPPGQQNMFGPGDDQAANKNRYGQPV